MMSKNDRLTEMKPAADGRKTTYVPVWTEVILLDRSDVIQTSGPTRGAFDADGEELE